MANGKIENKLQLKYATSSTTTNGNGNGSLGLTSSKKVVCVYNNLNSRVVPFVYDGQWYGNCQDNSGDTFVANKNVAVTFYIYYFDQL